MAPNYKQQNYLGQTTLSGIRSQAWPTKMKGSLHQTRMYIPLYPPSLLLQHLLCVLTQNGPFPSNNTICIQKDSCFFQCNLLSEENVFSGDCFSPNFLWEPGELLLLADIRRWGLDPALLPCTCFPNGSCMQISCRRGSHFVQFRYHSMQNCIRLRCTLK